jgi:glycosyltransferase involved in cell wall biosynthesis
MVSGATKCVIAVAKSEADEAVGLGLSPRGKIAVVRTGIKVAAGRVRHQPKTPKFLHFTRFDEQKNFGLLVEIASYLSAHWPAECISFVVVGRGSEGAEERCRRLVQQLGLDRYFEFRGSVEDIASLHMECVGIISTSRWEGLPLAVLEAGLAGLPMVLSAITAHLEIVDGLPVRHVFRLDDPSTGASHLVDVARMEHQPESDRVAQLLALKFSYDSMIEQHVRIYRRTAA